MALPNTHFGGREIAARLAGARQLWFIGIGGVHMSSLALLARRRGFSVAGSDRSEGVLVRHLRAEGVQVFVGHDGSRVGGADAVIYTLAADAENPEYRAARAMGLPLFSRADFLDFLLLPYPHRIGVAGSHGKSTVTSMVGELLAGAGRAPTVVCGAAMRRFGTSYLWGDGEEAVFEACEYQDSFLCLSPTLAVLLNAGFDHADYFENAAAAARSFGLFAASVGEGGRVLVNADDEVAMAVTAPLAARRVTFGFSQKADYCAQKWEICGGTGRLLLRTPAGVAGEVQLPLPGKHNLQNALAAAAAAALCGVSEGEILQGLAALRGVARRMEYKGLLCGARVFDDYAHHPDEIGAAIAAARGMMTGGRLFVLFESHTYSRTAAFFAEICAALSRADRIIVADIFPARETETLGMSGARLAAGVGDRAVHEGSLPAMARRLRAELAAGDLLLVMGAGEIHRIFGEFSRKDFTI